MKTLVQYITESKKHPLLQHEIKTDEFNPGDVVLFRELLEHGDENAIMVIVESYDNRALVAEIGSSMILGSSRTLATKELFKIGNVKINGKTIPAESIAQIFEICEGIGMDCTIAKKNQMKHGKYKF